MSATPPDTEYQPATEPDEPAEQEWMFSSLADWMDGWFFEVAFRYGVRGTTSWCPEWWRHPYATERLGALWQAWETMYRDPETISAWWVYHFDAHWATLTSTTGPFRDCQTEHTESTQWLESVPVPELWPGMPAVMTTPPNGDRR